MTGLFEPLRINQMVLKNRFVRSATLDGLADKGMVTDAEVRMYDELARGEVGLIISHGPAPAIPRTQKA